MFVLNWITGLLFIVFILFVESTIYKEGCVNCFYYGKLCAFGRGIIAPLLYKKGNPKKFCEKQIKFKDLIPMILVVAIPVVVGIALLISRGFNLLILLAIIYPVLSWFVLNPIIYGQLACPHCKQGSICCPAMEYFGGKKKKT